MTVGEYLNGIAAHLVHELEPIVKIKEVTQNSDLLGAYAEAAIRRLIRRVVHPMRVSTGAVVDFPMPPTLSQIDVIVWSPFPAPGLFDIDDFALVPKSSAFGLLEIKRSNYGGADQKLEDFANDAPKLVAAPHPKVSGDDRPACMGVVCVLNGSPSAKLKTLFESEKAIGIFEKVDPTSATATVRGGDVLRLINFLHFVGWRHRMQGIQLSYPQLVTA